MKKDDVFKFYRRQAEDNPEPETEREYSNVYQLLMTSQMQSAIHKCQGK